MPITQDVIDADQRHTSNATRFGVAGFLPVTHIVVTAVQGRSSKAIASTADVLRSTDIVIAAGSGIGCVQASGLWITRIISARISVIAIDRGTTLADAFGTDIVDRTGIIIATQQALIVGSERAFAGVGIARCLEAESTDSCWFRARDYCVRGDGALISQSGRITNQ